MPTSSSPARARPMAEATPGGPPPIFLVKPSHRAGGRGGGKNKPSRRLRLSLSFLMITKVVKVFDRTVYKQWFTSRGARFTSLDFEFRLHWRNRQPPVAYYGPMMTRLRDEHGNGMDDTCLESDILLTYGYARRPISRRERARNYTDIRRHVFCPPHGVRRLYDVQGYLIVVTKEVRRWVTIHDPRLLIEKAATVPALYRHRFKVDALHARQLSVKIDGGANRIDRLHFLLPGKKRLWPTGESYSGDQITYEFDRDISRLRDLKMQLITSETCQILRFSYPVIKLAV